LISVLLVDDHEMFRHGVAALLKGEADIEVVGQAADGIELLRIAAEICPDVVCMDVSMPKLDGIEATRQIVGLCPGVKIIGVSALIDRGYVRDMLSAGALGYIAKASAGEEIRRAIRTVYLGKTYLCPNVLEVVTDTVRNPPDPGATTVVQLGARERQVLQLIAKGCKSSEIAVRLKIAPATVDVHRRNIMHKLNLRGIAELTRYAIRNGLISGEG
jgi:DNA-binding NarL/FixJ family response regulator